MNKIFCLRKFNKACELTWNPTLTKKKSQKHFPHGIRCILLFSISTFFRLFHYVHKCCYMRRSDYGRKNDDVKAKSSGDALRCIFFHLGLPKEDTEWPEAGELGKASRADAGKSPFRCIFFCFAWGIKRILGLFLGAGQG